MSDSARIEYTKRGWSYIECSLCGAKHEAGRAHNGAGQAYVNAEKEEWWAKHTGVPQTRYAYTLDEEDIPELCPYAQN